MGIDEIRAPATFGRTIALAVLCVCAVAGALVLFEIRDPNELLVRIAQGRAAIHAHADGLGPWAPAVFVLGYAILMVLIWVPSWPCSMLGGFLFGALGGSVYSLAGSTLGAVAAYGLSRSGLAHRLSQQNPLLRRLRDGFHRDALEFIVALRIMPVMPFGIVHVAAAMFKVPLGTFTLGTAIGMIPCVAIYALLGTELDRLAQQGRRVDATAFADARVWGPLLALAALALVPVAVRRLRSHRASP